jgi:serine/threonine protein kinase
MRTILDRYALSAPIGSGGMGTLWEGTDQRLNRKVAVKLVRSGSPPRRFYREARITARLGHPGVPVLYDFGTSDGELFMVMEYVNGATIADLIAEVTPLPVSWAAAIGSQVCAVLAAAHELGLVHRDLKPGNVMICPDGSAKVLDFGVACALDPAEFSRITRSGEVPGTAMYMAPEVAAGEPAEPNSDLYSLGCLMHELLTGRRVFASHDLITELSCHASEPPGSLRLLRPEIPVELDGLILELLGKKPDQRPAGASSVFARLIPFVRDLPPLPGFVTWESAPTRMYATVLARVEP